MMYPTIQPQIITQGMIGLLCMLIAREMVRKAIALWKAGTQKQLAWFICLFIFNTAGLLPIVYLIFFQKKVKVAKVVNKKVIKKRK